MFLVVCAANNFLRFSNPFATCAFLGISRQVRSDVPFHPLVAPVGTVMDCLPLNHKLS